MVDFENMRMEMEVESQIHNIIMHRMTLHIASVVVFSWLTWACVTPFEVNPFGWLREHEQGDEEEKVRAFMHWIKGWQMRCCGKLILLVIVQDHGQQCVINGGERT
jgi:hypothetical protein